MDAENARLLESSAAIADRLVSEAVWSSDQCTWLSAGETTQSVGTLDPWLYSGDSGVALFLAEAARLTGSQSAKAAALGAIRRAIESVRKAPIAPGLYEGTLGVALAASRVGTVTRDDESLEAARELACHLQPTGEVGADLIAGIAGDVLALVTLAVELAEPSLLSTASDSAAQLIERANVNVGMSWSPLAARDPNLTGLAHGAASAVLALSELFGATGDQGLLPAMEAGAAFERSQFDDSVGNWIDLRHFGRRRRASTPKRFMVAWCHGGPGIALSRMAAYRATRDVHWKVEARIGSLTAEQRLIEASSRTHPRGDWSLCHGIGGLIDVVGEQLRLGGNVSSSGAWTVAQQLAAAHAAQYGPTTTWPCGAGGLQTPGLMTGLAGVGLALLRMIDYRIPSVLWVRPSPIFG